ncbi:MAG: nucleotidyltransferase family protein, partial [Bacteroidales bacterium]
GGLYREYFKANLKKNVFKSWHYEKKYLFKCIVFLISFMSVCYLLMDTWRSINISIPKPYNKMSPSNQFLTIASQITLNSDQIQLLYTLANQDMDWDLVLKKSNTHAVSQLIYFSLKKHNLLSIVPKEVESKWQQAYWKTAMHNQSLQMQWRQVQKHIPFDCILLKGMALSKLLYPSIGIRSMGDIDLLVPKEKVAGLWKKLLPEFESTTSEKSEVYSRNSSHLPPLIKRGLTLELHWNISRGNQFSYLLPALWREALVLENNIYALSYDFMLLHLCIHFAKHYQKQVGLRMLCDINEWVLKYKKQIQWNQIQAYCENDKDLKSALQLTLSFTHSLLQTPIPSYFIKEGDFSMEQLEQGAGLSPLQSNWQNIKQLDSMADKVEYIYRFFYPDKKHILWRYGADKNKPIWRLRFQYWKEMLGRLHNAK